ncbi:unknown similar to AMEV173 [Choristoneura rosaceana entomopoxvirus 'L']|uniref:Uncharacterized protein n=1 Tax=Choristoneura rosaceana entomopoxvirus 'L' TaxID=1293539 RepID=A0ABM9QKP1_9POXV|nr:unknown similar to AMEV173 [Choristoneura rosaceana entomopoxvirus 'L']CCU56086.1 unknown similar to AMEV173 [Choristoneura rosaceana entomopoxvirus 'L']
MYYSNLNLLIDLRKISLLTPKLYCISISIYINNIEKYIKYYNKIAKNINRKYKNDIYKYIDIDKIYNLEYPIKNRNIPTNIHTYNCYYLNSISSKNILKSYKYVNGLDSIIYHRINKVTDTTLFLIYKNNGMNRSPKDKYVKLKYCINIWDALHKLDYELYYSLNLFLKKNSSIDYIRCILSTDNNYDMETLYLNIMNNVIMYCKFNINILFYRNNGNYYHSDPLIFKPLEHDNEYISNEIIFIDKNYNIGICRNIISSPCVYIDKFLSDDKSLLKIKFKNANNKTYTIMMNNIYLLSYYDLTGDIYIYLNNNNEKKFYSSKLSINNCTSLEFSYVFIHNFKIYNTTSDIVKICIYNNIYDNLKIDFENIGITNNEDIYTSIQKIINTNNITLFKKFNKLINKTVKYHIKILDKNFDLDKYKILFDFLTYIYMKSQSNR